MRVYQALRLYRFSFCLLVAGILVGLLGLAEVLPEGAMVVGLVLSALGYVLVQVLHWWLGGTEMRAYQFLQAPEGLPVAQSGELIDEDTSLEIDDKLLAPWGSNWWRVVVVEVGPRDRVLVRYVGWDEAWEEPRRRSDLQRDVGAPSLPPEPHYWAD